jgi:DNA-binding NarL/FixJ family response regulator
VDDDPLARAALQVTLNEASGIALDCVWGSAGEILASFERQRPEAVLVDLMLTAGDLDGIDLALAMRDRDPSCILIILTSSASPDNACRAWTAGIPGYLTKHWLARNMRELASLIRCMIDGVVIYQVDPRSASMGASMGMALSEREIEVLRHKAAGRKHRDIADDLCIGVRTVDSHLANARAKLGAGSIPETLRIAQERGVL